MTPASGAGSLEYVVADSRDVLSQSSRFGGPEAFLCHSELAASQRFTHPADCRGYLGAHILFRVMAARILGTNVKTARDLLIHRRCHTCAGDHGKPVIDGCTLSLSRSRDQVLVAGSGPGPEIGADLEAIVPQLHKGFDDFALSAEEGQALANSDVEARIRLWVAKEAALKATGQGLTVRPGLLHIGPPASGSNARTSDCWSGSVDCPELIQTHGLNIAWLRSGTTHAGAVASSGQPTITGLDIQQVFP